MMASSRFSQSFGRWFLCLSWTACLACTSESNKTCELSFCVTAVGDCDNFDEACDWPCAPPTEACEEALLCEPIHVSVEESYPEEDGGEAPSAMVVYGSAACFLDALAGGRRGRLELSWAPPGGGSDGSSRYEFEIHSYGDGTVIVSGIEDSPQSESTYYQYFASRRIDLQPPEYFEACSTASEAEIASCLISPSDPSPLQLPWLTQACTTASGC